MRSFITCTLPPNIIRRIKPRRMEWAGHIALMIEKRYASRDLVGKPEVANRKTYK
jgi:hypothetical protein